MGQPRGYLLCATPRTGSTLLCSLLESTGVLGNPQSYFRQPDEQKWASQFGLAFEDGQVKDYAAFVQAVRHAGTTPNTVFGARVMWGSLEPMRQRLDPHGAPSDADVIQAALGPLQWVHLQREDVAAQAASWCRAEQTGYWQQGDTATEEPHLDLSALLEFTATITEQNAAWRTWFAAQGIQSLTVTYEELVADRRATIGRIATSLNVALPARWQPSSPHRKQADKVNHAWVQALANEESPDSES